eukprot:gene16557-22786_t
MGTASRWRSNLFETTPNSFASKRALSSTPCSVPRSCRSPCTPARPSPRNLPVVRVNEPISPHHAEEFTEFMNADLKANLATSMEVRHVLEDLRSPGQDEEEEEVADMGDSTTTPSVAPLPEGRVLMYKTIMLKLSGEALSGPRGFGVDPDIMNWIAAEVAEVARAGVKVAVVVGGGNYFRGATAAHKGLERATADYVGMLATVMNSLQLQAALEHLDVPTRVQTAIEMREVAEPYIRRRAVAHLNAGRVVIFGAGTGNPFFTTDTAAALRAAEINAEVFIKCTKVDGIFDSDPFKNPLAKKYNKLSYRQCTTDSLQVMDETAITLCKENDIPVVVLNMLERGNIMRAVFGEDVGTTVLRISTGAWGPLCRGVHVACHHELDLGTTVRKAYDISARGCRQYCAKGV